MNPSRFQTIINSLFVTLFISLGLASSSCVRLPSPIYDEDCGPWYKHEVADSPTFNVIYFRGHGEDPHSAAKAEQEARAAALVAFATYCGVHISTRLLTDKFELTEDSGTRFRMMAQGGTEASSDVFLEGIRAEFSCRITGESNKERYQVWTLISADKNANKGNNCDILRRLEPSSL